MNRTHIDEVDLEGQHVVEHTCDDCSVSVKGTTGDPQEGAWLFCPECGYEMEYEVDWREW